MQFLDGKVQAIIKKKWILYRTQFKLVEVTLQLYVNKQSLEY